MLRTLTPANLAAELEAAEEGKTVAGVMTWDVVTISPETTLAEAAHLMVTRRLKRLPVVDADRRLLGVISRVDLLRTRAVAYPRASPEEVPHLGVTVGEMMRRDVPVVVHNASLGEVLDAVISTRLNRAIVVDEARRVLGIVSDAELMRRLSTQDHPSLGQLLMSRLQFSSLATEQRRELARAAGKTAEELMIPNISTVTAETPLGEAIATMLSEERKILPVVDDEGHLLGAVDRADLLQALVRSRGPASGEATSE